VDFGLWPEAEDWHLKEVNGFKVFSQRGMCYL